MCIFLAYSLLTCHGCVLELLHGEGSCQNPQTSNAYNKTPTCPVRAFPKMATTSFPSIVASNPGARNHRPSRKLTSQHPGNAGSACCIVHGIAIRAGWLPIVVVIRTRIQASVAESLCVCVCVCLLWEAAGECSANRCPRRIQSH